MFLARLGSLNALEGRCGSSFWARWLEAELPSADSLGRIASQLDHDDLRLSNQKLYRRLKRNKALPPPSHGLMLLCFDGHESHASYRRCCAACLQRTITTAKGERIQYYHRHVTAMLIADGLIFLVDLEAQRPGEDEVTTALRLLDRVLDDYPRAFDVVGGDALYADPRVFEFARSRKIEVLAVLKDDRRDLVKDVQSLCEVSDPTVLAHDKRQCRCWDFEGLRSWPTVKQAVRVLRSQERWTVTRQLDGSVEEQRSEWLWVTTLSATQASTSTILSLGHSRWMIENEGFNELANRWHADHVYRHEAQAMLSFALLCYQAFNLFHAFFHRNLKPELRAAMTMLRAAQKIRSDLDAGTPTGHPP